MTDKVETPDKAIIEDAEIRKMAPYAGRVCNEHWINGFKSGMFYKPQITDNVKKEAILAANRSQFKSNHIYDYKSYEDGFTEGWQFASLQSKPKVSEECDHIPQARKMPEGVVCVKCGKSLHK
jgi:hypothetical protein